MKAKYRAKELSWLAFNARVLQEAADPDVPLLERIKFLGIFSSNLDEFFRVRVATLKRLTELGPEAKVLIGHSPKKVLKQIQEQVLKLNVRFNEVYEDIVKSLEKKHIFIVNESELSTKQAEFVTSFFKEKVRPKLIPVIIDQVDNFPDLKEDSIYLAVCLFNNDEKNASKHALIEVPTSIIPRFISLPKTRFKRHIILLDDVIRFCLDSVFSIFNYDRFEAYTVKLTRDAELDLDDDLMLSYIDKVSSSLKQRKEAQPVRFIYDSKIPQYLLEVFVKRLKLSSADTLVPGSRYHNFKDFIKFPDFGLKDWINEPVIPHTHSDFQGRQSILQVMSEKDILLHYPYQPFHYIIDLLREAAMDPKVTSIKITLYRLAKYSGVINALINAVKNGKEVLVVLELQARFDEEANIYWANRLQEEGVRVLFGVSGLKVHSKLLLISRKHKKERYAVIGTGNFNEDTAKIYSDHSLFTSNKNITAETAKVFDFLENNYNVPTFKHLVVSPFNMRNKIRKLIRTEINNAIAGKEAYITIKLNNLVDQNIIKQLYKASQAGVKIRLMVRGMFSLLPGVPGMSENIEAFTIVDKYLEHTRILLFCNGGDEKFYITSADLMPRNIDRRVEVTCPIYDKNIQDELRSFLCIQWQDNTHSRILDESLSNSYKRDDEPKVRAQTALFEYIGEMDEKRNRT